MQTSWFSRLKVVAQNGPDPHDTHAAPASHDTPYEYTHAGSFHEALEHMSITDWRSYHQSHNLYKFLDPDHHKAIIQAEYIDELRAVSEQLEAEASSNPPLAKALSNSEFSKSFIVAESWHVFLQLVTFPQYPHFECNESGFPQVIDPRTNQHYSVNPKFLNPCDPRIAPLLQKTSVFYKAFMKLQEAQRYFTQGKAQILEFFGQKLGSGRFNFFGFLGSRAWEILSRNFYGPTWVNRGLDLMNRALD